MRYSLHAVKIGRQFVLVNLSEVNRIFSEQIYRRRFSFLGSRKNVCREHIVRGYKADLFIEDSSTLIEIKTLLASERSARFPSIDSKRSIGQLLKLKELLQK